MRRQRQKIPDGSASAKAIYYSLNRWAALTRFIDDGELPIDNNWVKNQIRPIALGDGPSPRPGPSSRRHGGLTGRRTLLQAGDLQHRPSRQFTSCAAQLTTPRGARACRSQVSAFETTAFSPPEGRSVGGGAREGHKREVVEI
jgi:hypothetical protein